MSLARQVFSTHCDPDSLFKLQLWEPEDDWVNDIAANLRRLVAQQPTVALLDQMLDVYGPTTLGRASGKHAKRAARRIIDEGLATGDPRKDPHLLVLRSTALAQAAS